MRQKTRAPGAARATFSTSAAQSTAIEIDAERAGAGDVALLLDGVAVGDAVGRGAGRQHHLDLGDRGGVEAGAEPGEKLEHLGRRIGLHRVEHAGVRQRLGEGVVVLADDLEIDDQAGDVVPAVVAAVAQELSDARGHGALLTKVNGRQVAQIEVQAANRPASAGEGLRAAVRWRHDGAKGSSPDDAALDWSGDSRSARPARMDKPLRCRPLEGRRDQRSPFRRCFKPRPPLSAGYAGFASGCRSSVFGAQAIAAVRSAISLRAAVRPLVRMPTDRHTATGTCEIGRFVT